MNEGLSNTALSARSKSERRLVERLSGWRVYGFFAASVANIGLLLILAKLPWMLNERQAFLVTAMVAGSLAAFLVAVAGFRFWVSVKLILGLAYSVACVWALASVSAAPVIRFNRVDIATIVLFPLVAVLITIGGVVISRFGGYHRGRVFSIGDVMLLVSAVAILLPILLKIIPQSQFVATVSADSIKSAIWFALTLCGWCVVVSNFFLRFLPEAEHGKTHWQVMVGWFLFSAMTSWIHCQFGAVATTWLWCSMLPIHGLVNSPSGRSMVGSD